MKSKIIFPEAVRKGDRVAIISPASPVKPEYIDDASRLLSEQGYEPVIMPWAKGPSDGSYAASLSRRKLDFLSAWTRHDIKAIICSRGGYGAMQILPGIPASLIRTNPKWLIGFSDISALHAFLLSCGVASLHAPMTKYIAECRHDGKIPELFDVWNDSDRYSINVPTNPLSECGYAEGILIGGNLAVLSGLADTPYDILTMPRKYPAILFIEDIGEAIYKVDRMLWRLYLSGTLAQVKGIITGQFTDSFPDKNFPDVTTLIKSRLKMWKLSHIPVAYDFPIGHEYPNMPMIEGSHAIMKVTPKETTLIMEKK